jgi:hypothetical protein
VYLELTVELVVADEAGERDDAVDFHGTYTALPIPEVDTYTVSPSLE